jgi:transcriptional regulator with XRE-family HTH domain
MARFGDLLRAFRREAGLTQEELAARAGLSDRGIRLLESGGAKPRKATLHLLVDALELRPPQSLELAEAARLLATPYAGGNVVRLDARDLR